jgi:hypothetical protein
MRSSLMIGLSLRLEKSSFEGGAPSFFADRTGDTICDDGLFIIVSVSRALAWCRGSEEESDENFSFCAVKKQNYWISFEKAFHSFVALKKANNNRER